MSRFSGKCDLCDHMMMYKYRTKEGSDRPEDLEKAGVYYSDEMECFQEFMKRTGGVLHQHKCLTVTEFNRSLIEKLNPNFKALKHTRQVTDKRTKSGVREEVFYTYEYYGKEYTLKEINKKKVYITVDIKIKTLLDLIPYYPHIVSMSCCSDGKETIYISDRSYAEEEYEKHLQWGYESEMICHYRKELQDHYKEVVLRYFNPEGRTVTEKVSFDEHHRATTKYPIDSNFDIEWDIKPCWSHPRIVDEQTIEIHPTDYELMNTKTATITYVRFEPYKLHLD